MARGDIAIFECTSGKHNKFYTLIDRGDGWMTVNYGRQGEWHKTITKPITEWRQTCNARIKRGYIGMTNVSWNIDYDKYLTVQDRLLKFREFTIQSKSITEEVYGLGFALAKFGELTMQELKRANELYKFLKIS